jgi:hypothetical protein
MIELMSKTEIIAELPHLSLEDLAEVQAKLDELTGETWHPQADLTDTDKSALNAALTEYQKNPDAGSPWDQVKARVQSQLRP